jgi:hypothetical protein
MSDPSTGSKQPHGPELDLYGIQEEVTGSAQIAARRAEDRQLAEELAEKYGLECVEMDRFRIDNDLFRSIPFDLMLRYCFIPEEQHEERMSIVVADPTDITKLDEIELLLGVPLDVKVGARSLIEEILQKSESAQRVLDEATEDFRLQLVQDEGDTEEVLSIDRISSDTSPIIKLVDSTVLNAIQRRASDIHVETRESEVIIKYRIDGVLYQAMESIDKRHHQTIISRIKVMSELDIAERRIPQDGRFKLRFKGRTIDFRVSVMPSVHGEDCVIRILDKESMNREFRDLRLTVLGFDDETTVWDGPGYRSHGLGKNHHPLRLSLGDSVLRGQNHHDRGSGRIPAQGHHPDPGEREERTHVRQGPALHSAPRSRHDHGGGDPRRGNCADRGAVGPYRSSGVHHRACE